MIQILLALIFLGLLGCYFKLASIDGWLEEIWLRTPLLPEADTEEME
jgi:hypothetical protein